MLHKVQGTQRASGLYCTVAAQDMYSTVDVQITPYALQKSAVNDMYSTVQ